MKRSICALAIGIAVAGCSQSAPSTVDSGQALPSTESTSPASEANDVPNPEESGPNEPAAPDIEAVDVADYTVNGSEVAFKTPTGNIWCRLTDGTQPYTSGCQARKAPDPAGATGNFSCKGNEIYSADVLTRGFYLMGDEIQPSCFNQGFFYVSENQKVLPYGTSVTAHGYTCISRETHLTCTTPSGHGFDLSMQVARSF